MKKVEIEKVGGGFIVTYESRKQVGLYEGNPLFSNDPEDVIIKRKVFKDGYFVDVLGFVEKYFGYTGKYRTSDSC